MGVLAGGEGAQELQLEEGDGELRGEPGEDQHPQESRTRQHQDHQVTVHTIFFLNILNVGFSKRARHQLTFTVS